jgi:hypothetical protein
MAVGCGEDKKNWARENGGSYSTGMARKERAEVSIFPREPARASPHRKIHPRECRGSEAGEERTLGVFVQSQEREGDKHRGGQARQQEQRYQTRALAALGPGRLFLAHMKHALRMP